MTVTESTVRALYDALARGDSQGALALFDPAIRWTEAERSPYYRGTVEGVAAVVETVLQPIGQQFESFKITPHTFLSEGNVCAAFGEYRGSVRATGRELRADFVHLWTVRDERLTSFRQYTDAAGWREALSAA